MFLLLNLNNQIIYFLIKITLQLLKLVLLTSTTLDHHILILLQNDIECVVDVDDGDVWQSVWRATRTRNLKGVHGVQHGLNQGVVGGRWGRLQGERAFAKAVKGLVAFGGDDPVLEGLRMKVGLILILTSFIITRWPMTTIDGYCPCLFFMITLISNKET